MASLFRSFNARTSGSFSLSLYCVLPLSPPSLSHSFSFSHSLFKAPSSVCADFTRLFTFFTFSSPFSSKNLLETFFSLKLAKLDDIHCCDAGLSYVSITRISSTSFLATNLPIDSSLSERLKAFRFLIIEKILKTHV